MKISIIIPTYNRPQTLLNALSSLQNQLFPSFEVLVIDNAADPKIKHLIADFNKSAKIQVRYIKEERLGVHYARNTAAKIAEGDLLLYADDDVTFDTEWVKSYFEAFSKNPDMAAAGGPVRPKWESPPPKWVIDFISDSKDFGILSIMEPYDTFQVSKKGYFFSCNMAILKTVLKARGGFRPEATGSIWIGNGETGLNMEMWANKDLIGYIPSALVYHHIPQSRMTVEYFCHRMANEGACTEYAYFQKTSPRKINLTLRYGMIFLSFLRSLIGFFLKFLIKKDRFSTLKLKMATAYNLSRFKYVTRLIKEPQFCELVTKRNWIEV